MSYEDPDGAEVLGLDGTETDATRKEFDDIDDYKNWTESTIQTKDGTPIPGATGWTRAANVWWASRDNGNLAIVIAETGLKRFRVTVTSPDGVVTVRNGMRCRWGILEQPSTVTKIVVTQMNMALTVGSSEEVQQAATHTESCGGSQCQLITKNSWNVAVRVYLAVTGVAMILSLIGFAAMHNCQARNCASRPIRKIKARHVSTRCRPLKLPSHKSRNFPTGEPTLITESNTRELQTSMEGLSTSNYSTTITDYATAATAT